MNKKKEFETLKQELLACRLCRERFGYEPAPVFHGRQDSKIMQISQAPSLKVHETGKPFNDLSGKKLRQEWYQIADEDFYNTENFYITSVGRCYPGKSPGKGDRLPPKICRETWLKRELELVDNELYIVIGKWAAEYLFPKEPFTPLIFSDKTLNGKPVYILPHPSPLNIKWFRDNPRFLDQRIVQVRKAVHEILNLD